MLALQKISDCVGMNGWLLQTHNNLCNKLEKFRQSDIGIIKLIEHFQLSI